MAIDVVGSKMKPENGYGQNGFTGPSSDTPGKHTTSGFLPDTAKADAGDWQTRPVSPEQKVGTTPTMRSRNDEGGKIPSTNMHRVTKPRDDRSFQR